MNGLIRWAALAGLFSAGTYAFAQPASTPSGAAFPNKPIRVVVPFAAGGPIDIMTRPLAQRLNEAMGVAVLVDNRAGANGIIGMENVAKAAPDGYSLVVSSGGTHSIGPHVYSKLPYDIFRDFTPVSLFVTMPELLVVHPALPVKSVKELVALARARPNQLNFGSSGHGGTPHLAGELLKIAAKIEMVHVPYKGMGPATMDLIAGQLQLVFADLPVLLQQVKADKVRALAVGTKIRSTSLPNVPTMAEAGYPQIEAYNWYAVFAPANTPRPIIARLNSEIARVMSNPAMKSFAQGQGAEPVSSTPEELGAMHKREFEKWGGIVRAAGVKPE
jgi:tripartite-type tricarboxylate transporter receptor subunit TctC